MVQQQIIEKQRECEENPINDPLVIHAEGCTTNGKGLIQFKKGAFVGLRSIMPKVHKFHSFCQEPVSGVTDGLPQYLVMAACLFSTAEVLILPVF
mmetsp:Transcript_6823/g.11510  ORF Transcript_6823/g.11510 Transcript_6823/m.11510 type:complete len:95 (+) Transcript_6823:677-961(+)